MAIATTKWLRVCLHYNEPWEEFLTKAVKPYVEVVLKTGVAERFFFERSWDRGPHIRLWFKSTEFLLENMLKPNIQEHFQQYFESKPSYFIESDYPKDYPWQHKWRPNNSMHFESCHPEQVRQGGLLELSIVEKQFQASSLTVLGLMKDHFGNWTQNQKISTAIRLHLSMLYAFSMNLEEGADFMDWLYQQWLADYRGPGYETIEASFLATYDHHKRDILPYQTALWELLKNYRKVENVALVKWIHANTSANLELSLALDDGRLKPLKTTTNPQRAAWPFVAEFLKKTNNRLGIFNKTEGYLLFAMAQNLRQMELGSLVVSAYDFR